MTTVMVRTRAVCRRSWRRRQLSHIPLCARIVESNRAPLRLQIVAVRMLRHSLIGACPLPERKWRCPLPKRTSANVVLRCSTSDRPLWMETRARHTCVSFAFLPVTSRARHLLVSKLYTSSHSCRSVGGPQTPSQYGARGDQHRCVKRRYLYAPVSVLRTCKHFNSIKVANVSV